MLKHANTMEPMKRNVSFPISDDELFLTLAAAVKCLLGDFTEVYNLLSDY